MKIFFNNNLAILFSLLLTSSSVVSQTTPRYGTSCSLLLGKIYCFGGVNPSGNNEIADTSLNVLDIVANSGSTLDHLQNQWIISNYNANGVNLQSRSYAQSMPLPDGKRMLLSGGWNLATTSLVAQTIVYNAETKAWYTYSSYSEPPYGNRQIYQAATAYVPNVGFGFYGGSETNINSSWTYPGINSSLFRSDDGYNRWIGYTGLTFLNIDKGGTWSVYNPQNNMPTTFSTYQASVFDAKTNIIYYIGGRYRDMYGNGFYHSFSSVMTFNMTSASWGSQNMSGSVLPTPRNHHTVTLLTGTQRDVVLYGGGNIENNDLASADYCYTFNLDQFVWRHQNIIAPENVPLARTEHSAVLVNNNTLFIVFGKDNSNTATMAVLAFNTNNPSNITLLDRYVDPMAPPPSSRLSSGAIVGIAVGVIIATLLIIAAIVFYIIRKKRLEKANKAEELENQKKIETAQILNEQVMDVNWDEIEKNYTEISSPLPMNYSPTLAMDDASTDVDTRSTRSPMLIQQGLLPTFQRPNAVEEEKITVVPQLQKPDGAGS